jgi:hypothetical protein
VGTEFAFLRTQYPIFTGLSKAQVVKKILWIGILRSLPAK